LRGAEIIAGDRNLASDGCGAWRQCGSQVLLRLAERDPLPHWNEPAIRNDSAKTEATVAETRLAKKLREGE
jgi:hypothetical protein